MKGARGGWKIAIQAQPVLVTDVRHRAHGWCAAPLQPRSAHQQKKPGTATGVIDPGHKGQAEYHSVPFMLAVHTPEPR